MIITISTTHYPATDLGYLLHKHPDKFQSFDISIGQVHVFYPEATEALMKVCMVMDIDPVQMIRGNKRTQKDSFALGHYVNDRPYVASSFASVALAKVFSSALNGKCKDKPELIDVPLPFEVTIAVVSAPAGGEGLIRNLFEPLGYNVTMTRHILDDQFPDWGESKYYTLHLQHVITAKLLLSHLYVLLPALDNEKHYFVDKSEIEKLLQKGGGWLKDHPHKEQITRRYLSQQSGLARNALDQLMDTSDEQGLEKEEIPEKKERKESLHTKRLKMVVEKLVDSNAKRVLDLGCGEGKLLQLLLKYPKFSEIAGMDVSYRELLKAKQRLHYDELFPMQKERINLFQGALTYMDKRLQGYDAAAVVEVIEHLDLNRLKAFERVLFEFARPKMVVLTTPNKAYNIMWENMEIGAFRHDDHRFEWDTAEFEMWAKGTARKFNYEVEVLSIGDVVENIGAPSQMAIFRYGN